MTDAILVLNAGSSSLKFSLHAASVADRSASESPASDVLVRGQIERLGAAGAPLLTARTAQRAAAYRREWPAGTVLSHAESVAYLLDFIAHEWQEHRLVAVGHRVVHGGADFDTPVRVNADVLARLQRLVPLAPLHQPHNLAAIQTIAEVAPTLPQVACFDTAFHRAQATLAQTFGLPPEITGRGVRRYGFHGLSYEYVAQALRAIDSRAARGRVIVAHLGNGASMCAMHNGTSVATTMGFTPLDGLMMGTRGGSLDPGVILYLLDELQMHARAIEKLLYRQSGLLGVSGISSDMRTLLASKDPRARFAIDLFCYRAKRELGSLAASLDGLDALVFTGGIGENAAPIRERICQDAAWLGVALDREANLNGAPRISLEASRVPVWIVPTDEETMIARHVGDDLSRN